MTKKKLKIGIVGCGAIGTNLAFLINKRLRETARLVAFCDIDGTKAKALRQKLGCGEAVRLDALIRKSDLVIEAAHARVSFDVAKRSLLKKKDVLVMSIGGILGKEKTLFEIAKNNHAKIYLPSGAICGLDGLKALTWAGIDSVTLKTFKPPEALKGADYIVKNKIDLSRLKEEKVVFRGRAFDAVKAFPQNINVVALLSIAARGGVVPRVEIVATPGLKRNVHRIEILSKAAHLAITCENVPSPDNPKTSYLAILSAFSTIAGMGESFRIGG